MRRNPASPGFVVCPGMGLARHPMLTPRMPVGFQMGTDSMRDAHRILVIDSNDWDAEQIRAGLRELPRPVRLLRDTDLDRGETRVDLVILGFSDAVSMA